MTDEQLDAEIKIVVICGHTYALVLRGLAVVIHKAAEGRWHWQAIIAGSCHCGSCSSAADADMNGREALIDRVRRTKPVEPVKPQFPECDCSTVIRELQMIDHIQIHVRRRPESETHGKRMTCQCGRIHEMQHQRRDDGVWTRIICVNDPERCSI